MASWSKKWVVRPASEMLAGYHPDVSLASSKGRIDAARYVCKFRSRRNVRQGRAEPLGAYLSAGSGAATSPLSRNGGPSMGRLGPLRPVSAADGTVSKASHIRPMPCPVAHRSSEGNESGFNSAAVYHVTIREGAEREAPPQSGRQLSQPWCS